MKRAAHIKRDRKKAAASYEIYLKAKRKTVNRQQTDQSFNLLTATPTLQRTNESEIYYESRPHNDNNESGLIYIIYYVMILLYYTFINSSSLFVKWEKFKQINESMRYNKLWKTT